MIDSYTATSVIVGFLIIFGVLLPVLERIPKVKDIISFRWAVVVIYSALAIGVTLDFSHLDNSVRFVIVIGGIILSAIFLIVRSIEKAAVNHWKLPRTRVGIKKGNVSAELSVNPKFAQDDSSKLDASVIKIKQKEHHDDSYLDQKIECNKEIDNILNNNIKQTTKQHDSVSELGSFYHQPYKDNKQRG